jgi:hypothetical protein
MPLNPTSPQPPYAEPGKNRPDSEIRKPGSYKDEYSTDLDPVEEKDDIEPLERP